MDDGARHAPDRLWPDCGRGGISVVTWPRRTADFAAEPVERSFDQIGHVLLLLVCGGKLVGSTRLDCNLGRSERLIVKIPAVWGPKLGQLSVS
jgi:hypothetical protein